MQTKYGEIIKEIETRIEDGRLLPGERLPSVRALSKELASIPYTMGRKGE